MADTDQSLYNLRYNQVTSGMEAFGGGTPQWTPLLLSADGGVTSFNSLTGAVILEAGTGISLTPSGNTITVSSTGGASLPVVVASVALTGQHEDIPLTTIYTPSATGVYRASIYLVCTASDSSLETIQATLGWTDDYGAQSLPTFSSLDVSTAGDIGQATAVIEAIAGQPISYSFAEGGDPYEGGRYNLYLIIEKIN